MIKGHGGNIYDLAERLNCDASEIIDMSSNINPLGPLPGLLEFLKENIGKIVCRSNAQRNKHDRQTHNNNS